MILILVITIMFLCGQPHCGHIALLFAKHITQKWGGYNCNFWRNSGYHFRSHRNENHLKKEIWIWTFQTGTMQACLNVSLLRWFSDRNNASPHCSCLKCPNSNLFIEVVFISISGSDIQNCVRDYNYTLLIFGSVMYFANGQNPILWLKKEFPQFPNLHQL